MHNVSTFLDRTRWVAAMLVTAGHLRNFLMVDWGGAVRHNALTAAFYWLTGFGRIAVIVFFVLSGYLVGGRAFGAIEKGTFDVASYGLNRLSRLYPPLLVALVVTALLDGIGLHYGNALGYYNHPNTYHIAGELQSVRVALNSRTALLNLVFLQTLLGPTFGSDTPLWSLANEFWYYVLGPLAGVCLFGARRDKVAPLAALLALSAAALWLNDSLVLLLTTWFAGALAYHYSQRLPAGPRRGLLAIFAGLAAVARSVYWFPEHQFVTDCAIGASFAAVLWSSGRPDRTPADTWSSRLAGFSYSLYLVHVPLSFLLAAVTLQRMAMPIRLQPDAFSLAIFLIGMACSLGLAYVVSLVTEARTDDVRAWLARQLKAWTPSRSAAG